MTLTRSVRPAFLPALLATSLLLACGGDEQEPPAPAASEPARSTEPARPAEPAPAPRASREAPPVPPGATRPAEALRKKVELPDDYPSDAPVYPGTEPSQVSRGAEGRLVVMFGTEDAPDRVMDYMLSELPSAGWEVIAQQELPTGQLVQGVKGDRLISVVLSRLDEGRDTAITMIAVSVDS